MTYEEIAQWAVETYKIELYDSYSDWHEDIEQDFLSQGHFFPSEQVDPLLEREWVKVKDVLEPDKPFPPVPPEPREPPKTVGEEYSRRFEKFPSDATFTPRQLHAFFGSKTHNYNTLRRELSEFAQEGTLQRVKRGVYRIAP